MVDSISGVGVNNPEGVKGGAKEGLVGGDVEGENMVHPLEPGEHRVVGKKRHINIGSHAWRLSWGNEGLETIEGRKVSLVDRWILQKNYRRVGGRFSERLKQRKKNIPAPKAVMLNDGKKRGGRGRPLPQRRRHGLIIHYQDEPDE